jgi:hypothetical protein
LDVVGQAVEGFSRVYMDVTIVGEESADASRLRARAARDGMAAQQAEQAKRSRYSKAGADLIPFAMEQGGRLGEAAAAL